VPATCTQHENPARARLAGLEISLVRTKRISTQLPETSYVTHYFFSPVSWSSRWSVCVRRPRRRRSSWSGPSTTRTRRCPRSRRRRPSCICPPEVCPSGRRPNAVSGFAAVARPPPPPLSRTPAAPVQTDSIRYFDCRGRIFRVTTAYCAGVSVTVVRIDSAMVKRSIASPSYSYTVGIRFTERMGGGGEEVGRKLTSKAPRRNRRRI